jgi:hypothetical protein
MLIWMEHCVNVVCLCPICGGVGWVAEWVIGELLDGCCTVREVTLKKYYQIQNDLTHVETPSASLL